jgi:hypothetical protein
VADDFQYDFKQMVLREFKQVREDFQKLADKVDSKDDTRMQAISDLRVEIGMLKVKAGLIGAAVGTCGGALAAALVSLLSRGH